MDSPSIPLNASEPAQNSARKATHLVDDYTQGKTEATYDEFGPALLDALAQRDPEAGRMFYEIFRPYVYRYILHMAGRMPGEDIEDLVQEVLITAVRKLGTFKRQSKFRTWIIGITRNIVLDQLRRARLHNKREYLISDVDPDLDLEEAASPDTDPATQLLEQIEQDHIRAAMQKLKPNERESLVLHYIEDMSVDEVAQIMGKSRRAVEQIITRGRKRLRDQLNERK
jgi:RNA polymerase sigma-70 factor, ECF subfamily